MGPTATGKTALALRLAESYPIEIISVDSALIYRDMNIGTAKPSDAELAGVPHHLINIISPLQSYSVANFLRDTKRLVDEIIARRRLPVLVGGTMMYYNALINGISELPESDHIIRAAIEEKGERLGWDKLHAELSMIDPVAAKKIMPLDKQRITRALEVCQITQIPMTAMQQKTKIKVCGGVDFIPLAIIPQNREILHNRINIRFEKMLQDGLIDEVAGLKIKYPELTIDHTSMRCVGYYQVWQHLEQQINYTQLIEMGKAATRQLAKRQITWLKNMQMPNNMEMVNLDEDGSLSLPQLFTQLCLHLDDI